MITKKIYPFILIILSLAQPLLGAHHKHTTFMGYADDEELTFAEGETKHIDEANEKDHSYLYAFVGTIVCAIVIGILIFWETKNEDIVKYYIKLLHHSCFDGHINFQRTHFENLFGSNNSKGGILGEVLKNYLEKDLEENKDSLKEKYKFEDWQKWISDSDEEIQKVLVEYFYNNNIRITSTNITKVGQENWLIGFILFLLDGPVGYELSRIKKNPKNPKNLIYAFVVNQCIALAKKQFDLDKKINNLYIIDKLDKNNTLKNKVKIIAENKSQNFYLYILHVINLYSKKYPIILNESKSTNKDSVEAKYIEVFDQAIDL